MGKMQIEKGKRYERAVAKMMRPVFEDAKRGLQQCRDANEESDCSGLPYWTECKHHKNVSIQSAMKQAIKATDGRPPIVVSRDNRGEDLVTMRLTDWLVMAEAVRDLESVCNRVGADAETRAQEFAEMLGDEREVA